MLKVARKCPIDRIDLDSLAVSCRRSACIIIIIHQSQRARERLISDEGVDKARPVVVKRVEKSIRLQVASATLASFLLHPLTRESMYPGAGYRVLSIQEAAGSQIQNFPYRVTRAREIDGGLCARDASGRRRTFNISLRTRVARTTISTRNRDALFSVSAPRNLRQQNSPVAAVGRNVQATVPRHPRCPVGIDYEIANERARSRALACVADRRWLLFRLHRSMLHRSRRARGIAIPPLRPGGSNPRERASVSRDRQTRKRPSHRVIVISSAVGESRDNAGTRFLSLLRKRIPLSLSLSLSVCLSVVLPHSCNGLAIITA